MLKGKRIVLGLLVLGSVLLLAGCGTSLQTVRGNGVVTDTAVPLDGSFDRIVSQGSFDVILTNEPSDSLLFQIDENLLSYVDLDVRISGTTLYLSTRSVNNQGMSPTVFQFRVGAADLTAVSLMGSGSIRSDGVIRAEAFEVSVMGSGDVRLEVDIADNLDAMVGGSGELVLSGAANHVHVTVSGSGTANLREVPVETGVVTVSGSGVARVYVSDDLTATVSGSGDVFYYGDPQRVTRTITGSGAIRGR
ncbi:MAG: DUF2807 domain-containing protein [Oscillospiraceae bacterium]|nr:DUF2807 domain-containing protein [Oscillospiraceae bacterium]